jgi:hypothetical protein
MSHPPANPFQHVAAGVNATTAGLLRTAYNLGVFSGLDRRHQRVVAQYFTTDIGLRGLRSDAGLPSPGGVRRFLLSSLRDLRAALPAPLRDQYPLEALRIRSSSGYHLSGETRAKMSAAMKGRPSHRLGRHHSEAAKAKMRAAKLGHSVSLETRAKMRAAQRLRWQQRKQAAQQHPAADRVGVENHTHA